MYMRLVHVKVKSEELNTLVRLYQDRIIPALARVHGCRYAGLMKSIVHSDECVSLTLWDKQNDADAYEQSGLFGTLLDETRPLPKRP